MTNPRVQLRLLYADGKTFGPGKAELLALIHSQGSIAAAGREMKMSYKRAWGLIEEMNLSFRSPLVSTERGGAGRGGAHVTELGLTILSHYRRLEAKIAETGAAEIRAFADGLAPGAPFLPGARKADMFDET